MLRLFFIFKGSFSLKLMFTDRHHKLIILITVLSMSAPANCAAQRTLHEDSLLREAPIVFKKDHTKGFQLAQNALLLSRRHRDVFAEIKADNILGELYWESGSPDSADFYASNGLIRGQRAGIDSLAGDSWMIMGIADQSRGNYLSAAQRYGHAIGVYRKRQKLQSLAAALRNLGICQKALGRYQEAITNYFKAADLFAARGDQRDLAAAYNSIALCMVSEQDFKQAIMYDRHALAIREKLADSGAIAQSLNNIGFAYLSAKQPDSALFYLSRCLSMRRREKDSSLLILTLQNMGDALADEGRLYDAEKYISRSIKIAGYFHQDEDAAKGALDLAGLYVRQQRPHMALKDAEVAEKQAAKMHTPEALANAYAIESGAYVELKNYRSALEKLKKKNQISDSLFDITKNHIVQELAVKYQTAQRVRDLAALQRQSDLQTQVLAHQKFLITALITAGVLLALLLAAVHRNYQVKKLAAQRIQTLLRDLHHRVKNNLQILSALFSIQADEIHDEKTRLAIMDNETRLACMNMVHSELFLREGDTRIQMKDYLSNLLHYAHGVFGNREIALVSEISAVELDADKAVAIGLVVNEVATNAFKYAANKPGVTFVTRLTLSGLRQIILELEDNGPGMTSVQATDENSFGLKLIHIISKQLGATLTMTIENGTSYRFIIPM